MTILHGVGVSTIVVKAEMEVSAAATLHRFKLQVIISPVSAQVNTIHVEFQIHNRYTVGVKIGTIKWALAQGLRLM